MIEAATLEEVYGPFAARTRAPGVVAAAVTPTGLAATWSVGVADLTASIPVGPRTRFRIASMTKSLTALAVLHLRDMGRLRLGDPVVAYVPELAGLPRVTSDSAAITVRDLVHHLAGWVKDDPWADRQLGMAPIDFDGLMRQGWPAARPPGIAHEYANLGYAVLGRVIERAGGTSYQDYVSRLLLEPLGMTSSGFDALGGSVRDRATGHTLVDGAFVEQPAEPDGAFAAIGGLVTTAEDYARYVAFMLSAWPPRDDDDPGPIRRSTVRETAMGYGPPRPATAPDGTPIPSVYGGGLIASDVPGLGLVLQHAGGLPGFGSHVAMLPSRGLAVFGFTNLTYAQPAAENIALLRRLVELAGPVTPDVGDLLGRAAVAVRTAYAAGDAGALLDMAADNLMRDRSLDLRSRDLRALRSRWGAVNALRVEPEHRLAGRVILSCERGDVAFHLSLAPRPQVAIQRLDHVED